MLPLSASLPREDTMRSQQSTTQKRTLIRTGTCWHPDLGLSTSRTLRNEFLLSQSHRWASLVAQLVKNLSAVQEILVRFLGRAVSWRRHRLPIPVFLGFPGSSDSKESACNVRDLSSIPELGRFPGGGHGNPLEYSCLENPHEQRNLANYSLGVTKS